MGYIEDSNIRFQDTPNIDAFGRLRVSEVTTLLDMKQLHDSQPLLVDIETIGAGASENHSTVNAETTIATTATNDAVICQTFQRFNYQSGKSQLIFMTFSDFQAETNIEKRIGYFSSSTVSPYTADKDGIFLYNDGTDVYFQVYREGTEVHSIVQDDWDDPLNGSGESGITIDWGKTQIFALDFEWLGVGRIRGCLVIDGQFFPFHYINNANNEDNVYMSTPNQPLRWEIRQTGAGSGSMNYICASVSSEGGINEIGKILSDNQGSTQTDANSTAQTYALIGIRLRDTNLDAVIDLVEFSVLSASNDNQLWKVILNPTVGGTFTYANVSNASVQTAKASGSGNTITGGTLLDSGYLNQQSSIRDAVQSAINLGAAIDGTRDEIVLCTQPLTSNTDVYGSITWRERV